MDFSNLTGKVKQQIITDEYSIYNADCLAVMPSLPDNSIDASVYSPPFASLYTYSSDPRDVSNSTPQQFWEQYEMVVEQIHRLTKPGRLAGVHAAPIKSGNTGRDYWDDFPGDVIRLHQKLGWRFVARHVIWKEPLMVRNRLMTKGLAHKTIVENAAFADMAAADELLVFRKRGNPEPPISHPNGFDYYAGSLPIPPELHKFKNWEGKQTENQFSHWIWRRYASAVWDDIRGFGGEYESRDDHAKAVLPYLHSRDEDDEKHVHPLQLDVIARFVQMRTMPGETVLTPFMGVGSEVYEAVRLGRKGIGIELKTSYFKQAVKNLASLATAARHSDSATIELFDEVAA